MDQPEGTEIGPVRGAGKTTSEALLTLGLVISKANKEALNVPADVARRMMTLVESLGMKDISFTYDCPNYRVYSSFRTTYKEVTE